MEHCLIYFSASFIENKPEGELLPSATPSMHESQFSECFPVILISRALFKAIWLKYWIENYPISITSITFFNDLVHSISFLLFLVASKFKCLVCFVVLFFVFIYFDACMNIRVHSYEFSASQHISNIYSTQKVTIYPKNVPKLYLKKYTHIGVP